MSEQMIGRESADALVGTPETPGEEPAGNARPDAPAVRVTFSGVQAGGDFTYAEGDVNLTRYEVQDEYLRPHPLTRESVITDELFAGEVKQPADGCGIIVLLGDRDTGRRTSGIKLLAECPRVNRLFELYPDWDRPNVAQIPCEPGTGYLLDLTGAQSSLDEIFHRRLAEYAAAARDAGSLLVVIADAQVWGNGVATGTASAIEVRTHERPDALEVARRRIAAEEEEKEGRSVWLDEGESGFAGLIQRESSPERALELAEIILAASGPWDTSGLDRFHGWEKKIQSWFGEEGEDQVDPRAVRIAAAFLDREPARTVLDAADELLKDGRLHWPARKGGLLAAPDDETRCGKADLKYADGAASITGDRPGIDQALVRHLWAKREQLVPVITAWLARISAPGGTAAGSLPRLAEVLTDLAVVQGPDDVLELVVGWLKSGSRNHARLAAEVVDRLAVAPRFGAKVREELTKWAKGSSTPERQRAVADACRGRFGQAYPRVALTRLRYVLDSAGSKEVREAAIGALSELAVREDEPLAVLKAVVEWAEAGAGHRPSGEAFLALFTAAVPEEGTDPARFLLGLTGSKGEAACKLLIRGGVACWRSEALEAATTELLFSWRGAAEEGRLPEDAVVTIVSAAIREKGGLGEPAVRQVLGVRDPVGSRILGEVTAAVWPEAFAPERAATGGEA